MTRQRKRKDAVARTERRLAQAKQRLRAAEESYTHAEMKGAHQLEALQARILQRLERAKIKVERRLAVVASAEAEHLAVTGEKQSTGDQAAPANTPAHTSSPRTGPDSPPETSVYYIHATEDGDDTVVPPD